jgi:hypothetical protein
MTDGDDILLNSREVAFLLNISPDKADGFARRNILSAFNQGLGQMARGVTAHNRNFHVPRKGEVLAARHPGAAADLCM